MKMTLLKQIAVDRTNYIDNILKLNSNKERLNELKQFLIDMLDIVEQSVEEEIVLQLLDILNRKNNEKVKFKLITKIDDPNINRNIYTKECMESIVKQINDKEIPITTLSSKDLDSNIDYSIINEESIGGVVKSAEIKDKEVYCEAEIMENTHISKMLKLLKENEYYYGTRCIADYDHKTKIVSNPKLISIDLIPKENNNEKS